MNVDDTIFQGPNASGTITENVISYELIQFLELVNIFLFLIALIALFYYSHKIYLVSDNYKQFTLIKAIFVIIFLLQLFLLLY